MSFHDMNTADLLEEHLRHIELIKKLNVPLQPMDYIAHNLVKQRMRNDPERVLADIMEVCRP